MMDLEITIIASESLPSGVPEVDIAPQPKIYRQSYRITKTIMGTLLHHLSTMEENVKDTSDYLRRLIMTDISRDQL